MVADGEESDSIPVNSGVHQGSGLEPVLFLAYINDLPEEICSQVRLFADDTAVYLTIKGEEDSSALQRDLDTLSVWESKWDMQFNPSKCQVVQVTGSKSPYKSEYILHGQVLEIVTCARYLGVDISSNISWSSHIGRVVRNANLSLGYIRRNIKSKSKDVRESAYNTIVICFYPSLSPFSFLSIVSFFKLSDTNRRCAHLPRMSARAYGSIER